VEKLEDFLDKHTESISYQDYRGIMDCHYWKVAQAIADNISELLLKDEEGDDE
jgi:hypothetical protein